MKELLERIWLGNPIKAYLIVLGVIFLGWAFKRYISRYFAGLIFRVVNRILKSLDKKTFIKLVAKPLGLFIFILISIIALHKLHFPQPGTYDGTTEFENDIILFLNTDLYGYSIKIIIHYIATIVLIISFIWLLL